MTGMLPDRDGLLRLRAYAESRRGYEDCTVAPETLIALIDRVVPQPTPIELHHSPTCRICSPHGGRQ